MYLYHDCGRSLLGKWNILNDQGFLKSSQNHRLHTHEVIPPCDARGEKVGALYNAVLDYYKGVTSRACPRFLSPVPRTIEP